MGFFGFTLKGKRVEPRHRGVVSIDAAYTAVGDVLAVWRDVSSWPDAPPFSGGVWDAWPRRLAQGIALLKAETQAITMYLQHQEAARE